MFLRFWLALFVLCAGCGRLGYDLFGARVDEPNQDERDAGGGADGDPAPGDGAADGAEDGTEDGDDAGILTRDAGSSAEDAAVDPPPFESASFDALCDAPRIVVVEDGATTDDAAGAGIGAALVGVCLNLRGTERVSQDDPDVLDPSTGRILLGPDALAVVAGGPAVHRAAAYFNEVAGPVVNDRSTIVRYRLIERETGDVIVDEDARDLNDGHDFVTIMAVFEPRSGTRALAAYGREQFGTVAAATYLANQPDTLRSTDLHWLVVEWTDTDGDGPSQSDSYRIVASG